MNPNPSLEDRLRAHFADRAAHEPVPPPDFERVLARQQEGALARRRRGFRSPRHQPRPWLVAAAACLVFAVAAAGAIALRDDSPGRTVIGKPPEQDPGDETPTRPTTSAPITSRVPDTTPSTDASAEANSDAPTPAPDGVGGPPVAVALEGVLGWWDGQAWVRADSGARLPARGGEKYRIVRLDEPITTATGSAPNEGCELDDNDVGVDVGITHPDDRLAPTPVAVSGVAEPRPRAVVLLDPQAEVYRTAAAAVLADLGIEDADPDVVQVVRSDLEGDGIDEVLVAVQRLSDPETLFAADGDYSVVFVRRVVGGEVKTSVLAQSNAPDPQLPDQTPFVDVLRISALADLNGDGRMEVVLDGSYYEGSSTVVYEAEPDGRLVEVLRAGCGA